MFWWNQELDLWCLSGASVSKANVSTVSIWGKSNGGTQEEKNHLKETEKKCCARFPPPSSFFSSPYAVYTRVSTTSEQPFCNASINIAETLTEGLDALVLSFTSLFASPLSDHLYLRRVWFLLGLGPPGLHKQRNILFHPRPINDHLSDD